MEELINTHASAVRLMMQHNLSCLVCGEPVWETIEELAQTHGWSQTEIDALIEEMNIPLTESVPE